MRQTLKKFKKILNNISRTFKTSEMEKFEMLEEKIIISSYNENEHFAVVTKELEGQSSLNFNSDELSTKFTLKVERPKTRKITDRNLKKNRSIVSTEKVSRNKQKEAPKNEAKLTL